MLNILEAMLSTSPLVTHGSRLKETGGGLTFMTSSLYIFITLAKPKKRHPKQTICEKLLSIQ